MKHLYKLKRDGKTVGYMKWIRFRDELDETIKIWSWGYADNPNPLIWSQFNISCDSIHLYVTDDKNGKQVFEGDRVKMIYVDGVCEIGPIVWDQNSLRFCFVDPNGTLYGLTSVPCSLELIEEPENER